MIETLIKPVSDIVGKFVKDKDLQAKLDHELSTLFHQANLILNWVVWTFTIDIVPPDIDTEGLMTLTLSLLGLSGMRSFEKYRGVARNNMREENVKDSYKP